MARADPVRQIAEIFKEVYPPLVREFEQTERESVQTVVWLVGLSAGALALVVANLNRLPFSTVDGTRALVLFLVATIAFGACQRIFHHWAGRLRHDLIHELYGFLLGYTADLAIPTELSEDWDEIEIVRRLQSDFDLDCTFLLEYQVPLEGCRKAYQAQYDISKDYIETTTHSLGETIAAYTGLSEEQGRSMFSLFRKSEIGLEDVRRRSRKARTFQTISLFLFAATGTSFVGATAVTAICVVKAVGAKIGLTSG